MEVERLDFVYRFPVVRGIQANKEYYIGMVPLKMLTRLFPTDEEYVPPEFRAQRKLNTTRIPVISRYIVNNRNSYVFSALAASIDGDFSYLPNEKNSDTGILQVSMDARFLINDGQHRKAAIESALQEDASLGSETISVVFFADAGLDRSQQIFTDLNKHAVKTSNAIAELYDSRDPLAVITRNVVSSVPFLDMFTDKEVDNLGKYSSNLFSLNTFYKANKKILEKVVPNSEAEAFLVKFWTLTAQNITQWGELERKEISKIDLREKYIATQAVVILALGRVGATLYQNHAYTPAEILSGLQTVNWRRNAPHWKLRAINPAGRMITGDHAAKLIGNYLKTVLGLPLTEDELHQEEKFLSIKR